MSSFVRVVTDEGSVKFVNSALIVLVRPRDHKSFKDSGALVCVAAGGEQLTVLVAPGQHTTDLLNALRIVP